MNTTRRQFLATATAAACEGAPKLRAASRPNILLLMTDQQRGDCLGAQGNPVIRTPHLDRLAAEGVRFRCAYSSTPTCTPARAGLLTGQGPWSHGLLGYGKIGLHYPTEMPRLLAEAGYYTTAIGKLHYHPQRNLHGYHQALLDESGRVESPGFRSDYRSWFASQAPNLDPDATGIGWNDNRSAEYALPEELHPTRWTADCAVRFLDSYQRAQPFFLKVSFARPHSPYDPPSRWMRRYEDAAIPPARVAPWAARYAPRNTPNNDLWHGDLGASQVRRSRQGYYGSVSFIDEQIGRVLEALEKRGWLDETLIVFTSDHGDMTGDQNLWRKSYAYEPSAHIPLLLRCPKGLTSIQRGTVREEPVELRDILPTFLDAAGASERDIDGRSLLKLLRGGAGNWRPWIDLEHDVCYSPENHWNALTDGKMKYVFHARDGEEQLFDLVNDPYELVNLAVQPAAESSLRQWRGRLVEHLAVRGDAWVRGGKLALRPTSQLHSPNYPKMP